MVETLSRLMKKVANKNPADSIIRRYRRRSWHSTKLIIPTGRTRRFRPFKLKASLPNVNIGDNQERDKLPVGNNLRENSRLIRDDEYQTQHLMDNASHVVSFSELNTDRMEIGCSESLKNNTHVQSISQNSSELKGFLDDAPGVEAAFQVESPGWTPLSSNYVRRSQSGKLPEISPQKSTSATCAVDSGALSFLLAKEVKPWETYSTNFKDASGLSLSTCNFNGDANSYSQINRGSSVRISKAFKNCETKTFRAHISLQRSNSFSSFPVNPSPVKINQKCEDGFEKLYKKLCTKELQKPLTFTKTSLSPRKYENKERLIKSYFSNSSYQKCDNAFEKIYEKLCTEGFPKLRTYQRA
uniref:Uncharacterized protein n=1 Tax=Sphenodon punctatus TaxID=8508 RepID=A0A8D0LD58_SPHPU